MQLKKILSLAIWTGIAGFALAHDPAQDPLPSQVAAASAAVTSAARARRTPAAAAYYDSYLQGESVTEGLQGLEEQLEDQKKELTDLSDALDRRVETGHSGSSMELFGRIHLDYWSFPGDSAGVNALETGDPTISPQDRFGFRRLRIGVGGNLPANMLYKIEMEFAEPANPAFKDAFFGWNDLPILQQVLVGNQKRPYGLDHLNSSRYNIFLERPFIIEAFNQDARRLGIMSYGVSEDLRYNWRYGVFNQQDISEDGFYISDHYQLELAGRLASTYWYDETSDGRGYAHWAISGSLAHPDGTSGPAQAPNEARFRTRPEARTSSRWLDTGRIAGADWYELLGLESVVNVGPVQFVGEYQNVWLQRDAGFGGDLHFHGGYFYVSYFLTGEHMPWDRESGTLDRIVPFENFFLVERCRGGVGHGWGAWQLAARYSRGDLTDVDILGGVGEAFSFAVNWYWTPSGRVQFNVSNGRIDEFNLGGITAGDYTAIGLRGMVDF